MQIYTVVVDYYNFTTNYSFIKQLEYKIACLIMKYAIKHVPVFWGNILLNIVNKTCLRGKM